MEMAADRKREQERVMIRKLQRDREKEGDEFADKEQFVTAAYVDWDRARLRLELELELVLIGAGYWWRAMLTPALASRRPSPRLPSPTPRRAPRLPSPTPRPAPRLLQSPCPATRYNEKLIEERRLSELERARDGPSAVCRQRSLAIIWTDALHPHPPPRPDSSKTQRWTTCAKRAT